MGRGIRYDGKFNYNIEAKRGIIVVLLRQITECHGTLVN